MTALRRLTSLHRTVLAWWLLALAVAFASPLVQPPVAELVCSAAGVLKLVATQGDTDRTSDLSGADCPLCLVAGAPPVAHKSATLAQPLPLGRALQSIPAARLAAATASPLPARGPPSTS